MGFRLGPDGKPQEVESTFAKSEQYGKEEATQAPANQSGTLPPQVDLFGHMNKAEDNPQEGGSVSVEPPTTANSLKQNVQVKASREEPKTSIAMGSDGAQAAEYVCGWFVVIDGPGKGNSINIGPGQSSVSRSLAERITINFGDTSITSKQQLLVIFDDEMGEFIIGPGNGSSLNRLNGKVIAGQASINSGDIIKMGATTVRFVAFCGPDFSWG